MTLPEGQIRVPVVEIDLRDDLHRDDGVYRFVRLESPDTAIFERVIDLRKKS